MSRRQFWWAWLPDDWALAPSRIGTLHLARVQPELLCPVYPSYGVIRLSVCEAGDLNEKSYGPRNRSESIVT